MNCEQVRHHLDDFVRGLSDRVTGETIYEHVKMCPACRAEGALARKLIRDIENLRVSAPPGLAAKIIESVMDGSNSISMEPKTSFSFRAIAALLLVGIVGWFVAGRLKETAIIAPADEIRDFDESSTRMDPTEESPGRRMEEIAAPRVAETRVEAEPKAAATAEPSFVAGRSPVQSQKKIASEPEPVPLPLREEASPRYASSAREVRAAETGASLDFDEAEMAASRDTPSAQLWQPRMSVAIPPWSQACSDDTECATFADRTPSPR